jgi:L-threonylcarbamoyladenylate synthase
MPRRLPDILPIEWAEHDPTPPAATDEAIDRAARLVRSGGLVAIPTETVYGLATDALDSESVDRIFRAKGRPATNPLIVHVADQAMARALAAAWPAAAEAITNHFWPGPVTVVVPRHRDVPDMVTAGGPTVALRCPAHRLTRRLIERSGCPLAAPSANRSEAISPTRASHVLESLGDRVDLILDGGPCTHGIESTVVDCTTTPPRILRPGPIGREALEAVIGGGVAIGTADSTEPTRPARAPGGHARHYAPKTPLELPADPPARVAELLQEGRRVGWLTRRPADPVVRGLAASHDLVVVPMPDAPAPFAAALYATLHALDQRELDRLVCDRPPDTEPWHALHDRLTRAATG